MSVKLHFCFIPGETDALPERVMLHATAYQAAVRLLADHPDFKPLTSSYMGKVVFEGQDTEKLYAFTQGTITTDVPIDLIPADVDPSRINMMVYRNLSYDDFVSGLPVMTTRCDK